jgi:hypothetical protein
VEENKESNFLNVFFFPNLISAWANEFGKKEIDTEEKKIKKIVVFDESHMEDPALYKEVINFFNSNQKNFDMRIIQMSATFQNIPIPKQLAGMIHDVDF